MAAATDSLLVTANRGPPTLLKLALNLVAPQLGQSGLLNGTTVQQFGRLGGPSGLGGPTHAGGEPGPLRSPKGAAVCHRARDSSIVEATQ